MRFDQTAVVIRERSTLEVFDLAASVMVRYLRPIITLLIINALPFVIIDLALIGWMVDIGFSPELNVAYYWAMMLLVVSQAQLGTCLITIYLGQMMFLQKCSTLEVLKQFFAWRRMLYFLFSQCVLRMAAFAMIIFAFQRGYEGQEIYLTTYLFLPGIVFLGGIVKAIRPYTTEIIFLERPHIRKQTAAPTFGKRSSNLHTVGSASVGRHFLALTVLAPLLLFSVHSFFVMVDSTFNIRANSDFSLQPYYLVIACWLVAGFVAVVRFLMYLDLRIRLEGWAIQLQFMTENNLLNQRNG